jgi:eukaryotic translation initiation factor 2C
MGGPEQAKYYRREHNRQQAEAEANSRLALQSNTLPSPGYFGSPTNTGGLPALSSGAYARSESGSSSCSSGFTPPQSISGYDGPTDKQVAKAKIGNLELGAHIWLVTYGAPTPTDMPSRPKDMNKLGKECTIGLNTYHVLKFPQKPVFQYDISLIGDSADKRMVVAKVWGSKTVKSKLDPSWIFDGNKLAWSLTKLPGEQTIFVDLAAERGSKPSDKQKYQVVVRPSKVVKFDLLHAYLQGKIKWQSEMLETMTFLDHLMRENPSRQFTQVGKSFFPQGQGQARHSLGQGVEALKGVFASMRMVHTMTGPMLSVNVDVANGAFLVCMPLIQMARQLCRARGDPDLMNMFKHSKDNWHASPMYRFLRVLTHVTVTKTHIPPKEGSPALEFKIHRFHPKDPYEFTFEQDGNKISVAQYFQKKYQRVCLRGLPLVELTKKGEMVPLEMLLIPSNQRYKLKLDDAQTKAVSHSPSSLFGTLPC